MGIEMVMSTCGTIKTAWPVQLEEVLFTDVVTWKTLRSSYMMVSSKVKY
jgi:hypothetical protein